MSQTTTGTASGQRYIILFLRFLVDNTMMRKKKLCLFKRAESHYCQYYRTLHQGFTLVKNGMWVFMHTIRRKTKCVVVGIKDTVY